MSKAVGGGGESKAHEKKKLNRSNKLIKKFNGWFLILLSQILSLYVISIIITHLRKESEMNKK